MTATDSAPARTIAGHRIPVWLAIVAASLPMFMATLDNLVVTSALPVIARDLSASIEELQWVVNAYTLSFATLMLMAVGLGDRFGRRSVFLGGIVVFTLSSAAAALATEPWMLITARAVQGAGAAALLPLSLTLLAGRPVPERPRTGRGGAHAGSAERMPRAFSTSSAIWAISGSTPW